ncbi:MAG: NADH-quinone oxidoreductase subunit NuoG [Deltaproteobacteria bacterium]|nr:NADH-quinone oxidoreductase subunit NuoG [Deltaproteobacteria bacterium]
MVTVKINGKEITVEDNTLILDAARHAGYEIPTFCYQADLVGIGSCRMCLVEIEGQKKLQPSCVTPVLHGMSINTETPTVMSARASMLEFLLANHALDCPVCDKGGECELQDMVYRYGPHKGRHAEPKFKFQEKDYALSPVIIKNSNRCVQCMKCVRVCREVVGANVLGALGRGDHQEETSFFRHFLDCDQDGNCIEVCPVGCFMRLPYRYKTRPWDLKGADTICQWCGTGCRMVIEERDGVLIRSKAQLGVGLNSETLCARGRFGNDFMTRAERLKTPLVRRFGKLEPASWQEALAAIKENVPSDGEKIGGITSPRLTNEELYLFQKLFRTIFGSSNIDSSARFDADAVEAFIKAASMDSGGVSVFDCMETDTVLIVGSHVSDENPVTDYIIRRISAGRRMNLVIASPRAMKLDSSANLRIRHTAGKVGALLESVILSLNASKVEGAGSLGNIAAGRLSSVTAEAGAAGESVESLARKLKSSESVAIMAGTDFLRYPEGIAKLGLLKDLLKSLGKKVSVLPLLDRANQRGAWEMGVHPSLGPAYSKAGKLGLSTDGMLEAASKGALDFLYIAGSDVASMYPDEGAATAALGKVKFLVVQDTFMTETARFAHVVLPGAAFGEKEGTFTNQEGRAQVIRRLMHPPGKAKPDLDIIRAIGERFDPSFGPKNFVLALDEIRSGNPMYSKVSLAFNNKRNNDNRLDLKESLVQASASASPSSREFAAKAPVASAEYPFRLITGNHLFHSGKGTMRSETLSGLLKAAVVEISEEDALSLGLKNGERVRVKSKDYEAVVILRTARGSKNGHAFLAENFEDCPVNRFLKRGEGPPMVSITRA